MIACPMCDSQKYERYREPKEVADVTFRRHRCKNCQAIFLTAQILVSGQLADQMLELMESPINGSTGTPSDSATSVLMALLSTARASGATTGTTG